MRKVSPKEVETLDSFYTQKNMARLKRVKEWSCVLVPDCSVIITAVILTVSSSHFLRTNKSITYLACSGV